jgi:Methyltransferase domain
MQADFSKLVCTEPGRYRVGSQTLKAQTFGPRMDTASDAFILYKEPKHFEIYSNWWPDGFAPSDVLELGIWAGGSVVFWNELIQPKRFSALDIKNAESIGPDNLARLKEYQRQQDSVLRLYWETSQDNRTALERILKEDFPTGVDFVVDDASHLYGLSRSSFEIVFPRVRPGGWYVIEDWPWDLVDPFPGQEGFFRTGPPLSLLITDLVRIAGTEKNVIDAVHVIRSFTFVQRGSARLNSDFAVADYLPKPKLKDVERVARRYASHLRGRGW